MGRGRQKAKQTKVARKLKYTTQDVDIRSLQRELSGASHKDDDTDDDFYEVPPAVDPYDPEH